MTNNAKKGVRERMADEIQAEIQQQGLPNGFDADTMHQLAYSLVDAHLGLRSGRHANERKAAESIVTKLQQLVN